MVCEGEREPDKGGGQTDALPKKNFFLVSMTRAALGDRCD